MKNSGCWKLLIILFCLICSFTVTFSAIAAIPVGTLEGADESSVYGWAWDSDNYNHVIPIEISFYPTDSMETLMVDTLHADDYQDKLQESIGDGYHGFLYPVDWDQFEQEQLYISAYAVTDTERIFLGALIYDKTSNTTTTPHSIENSDNPILIPESSDSFQENHEFSDISLTGPGSPYVSANRSETPDEPISEPISLDISSKNLETPDVSTLEPVSPDISSKNLETPDNSVLEPVSPDISSRNLETSDNSVLEPVSLDISSKNLETPDNSTLESVSLNISSENQKISDGSLAGPGSLDVSAKHQESFDELTQKSTDTQTSNQAPVSATSFSSKIQAGVSPSETIAESFSSDPKRFSAWEKGPGIFTEPEQPEPEPEPKPALKPLKTSHGTFLTTGYCTCKICTGGSGLTYSGTVPKAKHTISADITIFPLGTKLMINDIVYTVEDTGSSIVGNRLDIYYSSHKEALAHGEKYEEVFTIEE